MPSYRRVPARGIVFVFKYEDEPPDMLHIFARHRKQPQDAIAVWLGATDHRWDDRYSRFEASHGGQGILWYWIVQDRVVMIVSCYDSRED